MPDTGVDVDAERAVAAECNKGLWGDVVAGLCQEGYERRARTGEEYLPAVRMIVGFVSVDAADVGGVLPLGGRGGIGEPACDVATPDCHVHGVQYLTSPVHGKAIFNCAALVAGAGHDGSPGGLGPGHDGDFCLR